MNTRRTGLIGVLVESLKNPYTTALLEELDRELSRHSLRMVLGTTNNPEDGRELLVKFSDGMVDGILNNLPGLDEAEARRLAAIRSLRSSSILRPAPGPRLHI